MSRAIDEEDADDRRARIEALFAAHRDRLLWFLRRRRQTADEAADIVQETFARLARVESIQALTHPQAFLFQTALNVLRDDVRKTQVRSAQAPALAELYDREVPTPERVLEGRQRLARFQQALDELTPRRREIFVLAKFEGQTHAQIARHLGISVSAVEKHIVQAIVQLDAAMEE